MHAEGGHIALQILHTGRYGYHPLVVAPSRIKSPITPFPPRALSERGIERQIKAFVRCAALAREAGYDGVEIMGSEGYFINQFLVTHTNTRTDGWGGSYANRMRLPVEIVRRTREAVGPDFIIIYRLSMLDLIPDGSTWEEAVTLAKAISAAGATIINTGIGWHEARVPTIATSVPRAAFTWVTQKMRAELRADGIDIPLVTTNRINTPEVAEQVLAEESADMVSMARPLLADAFFVRKAEAGQADRINTCIACNQACLDHAFKNKTVSCLVNPRAGHERDLVIAPTTARKRIAVVGAGPAGLAAATTLAERGHEVDLFDAADEIGGQFNLAKRIPGKEEFHETLRYFANRIEDTGVQLHLSTRVSRRRPDGPGRGRGGAGHRRDPARPAHPRPGRPHTWSATSTCWPAGSLWASESRSSGPVGSASTSRSSSWWRPASRPRWTSRSGAGSGGSATRPRTAAGWSRPSRCPPHARSRCCSASAASSAPGWARPPAGSTARTLVAKGVTMLPGVNYERITPEGLVVSFGEKHEREHLVEADTIVLCAGQEPLRELEPELVAAGHPGARDRRGRTRPPSSTPSARSTRAPGSPPRCEAIVLSIPTFWRSESTAHRTGEGSDLDRALGDQHAAAADPHAGHLAIDPLDPRVQHARAAHLHALGDPPRPRPSASSRLASSAARAQLALPVAGSSATPSNGANIRARRSKPSRPVGHVQVDVRRGRAGSDQALESGLVGAGPLQRRAVGKLGDDELAARPRPPGGVPVDDDVLGVSPTASATAATGSSGPRDRASGASSSHQIRPPSSRCTDTGTSPATSSNVTIARIVEGTELAR